MNDKKSPLEFPCYFPVKVFGKDCEDFISEITQIARKHYPDLNDGSIKINSSSQKNFVAITLTVYAQDKASLDALYMELTRYPDIKMVL